MEVDKNLIVVITSTADIKLIECTSHILTVFRTSYLLQPFFFMVQVDAGNLKYVQL